MMTQNDKQDDIGPLIKGGYSTPPPKGSFVESLHSKISSELRSQSHATGQPGRKDNRPGLAAAFVMQWRWAAGVGGWVIAALLVLAIVIRPPTESKPDSVNQLASSIDDRGDDIIARTGGPVTGSGKHAGHSTTGGVARQTDGILKHLRGRGPDGGRDGRRFVEKGRALRVPIVPPQPPATFWPAIPVHLPRNGMVALWLADDNAYDSAGKNHGTLCNGVTFEAGKFGKAFKLDGEDDYIDFGNPKALQITGSQTITMWIRPDRLDERRNPINKAYGGEGTMTLEPDGELSYFYGPAGGDAYPHCGICSNEKAMIDRGGTIIRLPTRGAQSVVKARQWTHIAIVRDLKAKRLQMYFNGTVVAECDAPFASASVSNQPLYIGRGYEKNFIGLIDEVAIWNRALSAAEVENVSRGLCDFFVGVPSIARVGMADRIALTGGSILLGTIENSRYTITTSFGKIEIPAGRVAGFVREARKDAPSRLVLADGQVLVGRLSEKAISLKLSTGSTLRVPIDSIIQCGYRITDEKPAALRPSGPMVLLCSGERLIFIDDKIRLRLQTPHGKVDLPINSLLMIRSSDQKGDTHRVQFRNGSVLTGTLLPEKLTLKLQFGQELTIGRETVHWFALPAKPVAPDGEATLLMRNGDRLLGRLTDKTLTIRTKFGDAQLRPDNVLTMKFEAGKDGAVSVKQWDGVVLRGQLIEPAVTLAIVPGGPTVKAPVAQIASIVRASALPPAELLKKIETLIARLGAAAFADRQEATKELIRIGPPAKSILEKHLNDPDPEIRQRIRQILKKINPPKPESMRVEPYTRKRSDPGIIK